MERDPVCGMNVEPDRAKATLDHAGKSYYFCCTGCADKFRADPPKYLNSKTPLAPMVHGPIAQTQLVQLGAQPAPSLSSAQSSGADAYTCPMHPEVVSATPGAC